MAQIRVEIKLNIHRPASCYDFNLLFLMEKRCLTGKRVVGKKPRGNLGQEQNRKIQQKRLEVLAQDIKHTNQVEDWPQKVEDT